MALYFAYDHLTTELTSGDHEAILFTAENCPPCDDIVKYLGERDVEFIQYDIHASEEDRKRFKKFKGRGFPLVIIGSDRIVGFDKTLLDIAVNGLYVPGEDADRVVVYTRPGCGWCTKVKEFLNNKGVTYEERDVSKSDANLDAFDALKGQGFPLVMVGDNKICGYNERALKMALKQVGLM